MAKVSTAVMRTVITRVVQRLPKSARARWLLLVVGSMAGIVSIARTTYPEITYLESVERVMYSILDAIGLWVTTPLMIGL